jgi:hypothetical protein
VNVLPEIVRAGRGALPGAPAQPSVAAGPAPATGASMQTSAAGVAPAGRTQSPPRRPPTPPVPPSRVEQTVGRSRWSNKLPQHPAAPFGQMAQQVEHVAQQAPFEVSPCIAPSSRWLREGQSGQSAASSAGPSAAPVSAPLTAPRFAGAFVPLDGDAAPFAAGV